MPPLFSEYTSLDEVRGACQSCIRCALSDPRQKAAFGAGAADADIMLIGQGPSLTDNQTGRPYSGPAGDLLDKALDQAGLSRAKVWITNLHKCVASKVNPKTNREEIRPPKVAEMSACRAWLDEEFIWVKPQVVVAIGGPAAQSLLGKGFQLKEERGKWQVGPHGLPTLAVFQPTYLTRLSQWDRPAAVQGWRDLVADLAMAKSRISAK